jgi:hypothetical protein
VRRAVAHSGVFAEAQAARGASVGDTKSLLVTLKALLRIDGTTPPPTESPEPPRRDGGVSAQKPVQASLAQESPPAQIAATLAREAEQAVERIKLHQFASLPDMRPAASDPSRLQQLSFELPLALAGQTAIAGFKVERDKRRKQAEGTPVDSWGIRFAIETDEIGAVHAHLRLSGHSLSVSLWADDAQTHRAFVAALPRLEAALRDNALEPGEMAVFSGKPHAPRTRVNAGAFLDVSS